MTAGASVPELHTAMLPVLLIRLRIFLYQSALSSQPVAVTTIFKSFLSKRINPMLPLLDISKGDPPPDPPSGLDVAFGVALDPAAAAPSLEDVVVDKLSADVVEEVKEGIGGIAEVIVSGNDACCVEIVGFLEAEEVAAIPVDVGVGFEAKVPLDTDQNINEVVGVAICFVVALVVGTIVMVTEACGGSDTGVEKHSAAKIPPFLIIPNSVCAFTLADTQASRTSACMVNRFAMQSFEHPLSKSFFLQLTICVSDKASAVGSARDRPRCLRSIVNENGSRGPKPAPKT
ncbi:uncharacterized protein L3040_004242 [Drepanopeziza brunnea f. sp. 'multigermtubi']|uniref:Uncharacterized protein n=1 Tax=Marssonina brunnea f. sp. multigermtubi (strain MB_m1) TaxID=1072389 RepID=K1X5R2_MARBU|nr:uncharacterized protein MBM_01153 [Drepanopeziza brunnea f. sp. 'multigermtubi' MB_m1]EKD20471.1 hypothetical protein MBM_01153 [Drepanopeziza brunnea f. sp. 'multigermtubi' MB_m1]KAJ5042850.1 hypothetical protein L3040_004242 [Drepanopeziza brunnea f. sp. 'multigermtubi']